MGWSTYSPICLTEFLRQRTQWCRIWQDLAMLWVFWPHSGVAQTSFVPSNRTSTSCFSFPVHGVSCAIFLTWIWFHFGSVCLSWIFLVSHTHKWLCYIWNYPLELVEAPVKVSMVFFAFRSPFRTRFWNSDWSPYREIRACLCLLPPQVFPRHTQGRPPFQPVLAWSSCWLLGMLPSPILEILCFDCFPAFTSCSPWGWFLNPHLKVIGGRVWTPSRNETDQVFWKLSAINTSGRNTGEDKANTHW